MRTALLTALTLLAFAGNSILCRLALSTGAMDPASFTSVRLVSGALVLACLVLFRGSGPLAPRAPSWRPAAMLALYAVPFSFAYVTLTAGTGALLLFGAVQVTMLGTTLWQGHRPARRQWAGVALALVGLVYLLQPGLSAPPLAGAAMMISAGIAWGVYSLLGRGAVDPLGETARNFLRAVPIALLASLVTLRDFRVSGAGLLLAVASGALASGLGYVLWYAALRRLSSLTAAIVQLAVPVLTALGGVALLGEGVTLRLTIAGVLVLGGIGVAVFGTRWLAPPGEVTNKAAP